MILTESEAKKLLKRVISYSKADSIDIHLSVFNYYNLRYALNSASTNVFSDGMTLSVTSNFGKRSGSVSTNRFEEDSLRRAIKRSEDIAKLSPENMEFMEPLGQQKYLNSRNYSRNTANVSSDRRSLYVSEMINKAEESNVIAGGYYEDEVGFTSIMNSKGLFAYNLRTNAGFSSTFRTKDGTGSSRVNKSYVNVNDLDTLSLSERAIKRTLLSSNPAELKPGRYTVILEPAAVADMLGLCLNFMGARQADEGRSY